MAGVDEDFRQDPTNRLLPSQHFLTCGAHSRAMAEAQGRRRSLSSSSPRIVQDATRAVATELRTVSGASVWVCAVFVVVVEFHVCRDRVIDYPLWRCVMRRIVCASYI